MSYWLIDIIFRFSCKAGAAGGIIYFTNEQGLWGAPKSSGKILSTINENVPQIKAFKDEVRLKIRFIE